MKSFLATFLFILTPIAAFAEASADGKVPAAEVENAIESADPPDAATENLVEKSLVRVNATRQSFDLTRPWEKTSPDRRLGLGAVIEGKRVLTTAEMVANATYVELEIPDSGRKATAEVVAIDYEANLALVRPIESDSDFLKDRRALKLATESKPGDLLHVWQIEDNGTPVSTPVVFTRGEVTSYFVDNAFFLAYEANGTLQYHGGSFTLPVLNGNRLAGMLLSYSSKEQVSNILPATIIEHFLREQADGDYRGFPTLGIAFAQTLDEQFRKYLGLNGREGGIYVSKVLKQSSAAKSGVKPGDVILEIAGNPIDARGNYDDPAFGKLSMSHLVRGKPFVGDEVPFKILRDGKEKIIGVTLERRAAEDHLVDPYMFDRGPKFLILGGLVFQELTRPYLKLYGDNWQSRAPIKLLLADAQPERFEKEGKKKIVFLTRVIPTPATLGYERVNSVIVTKVNGQEITQVSDMAEALKSPVDGIHKIEFDDFPGIIYVDASLAAQINEQLKAQIGTVERLK
ncbi:MAG: PDZ domain-containing protein [Verrucomicrobiota bacterium]